MFRTTHSSIALQELVLQELEAECVDELMMMPAAHHTALPAAPLMNLDGCPAYYTCPVARAKRCAAFGQCCD